MRKSLSPKPKPISMRPAQGRNEEKMELAWKIRKELERSTRS
jgi:hypothetical protein